MKPVLATLVIMTILITLGIVLHRSPTPKGKLQKAYPYPPQTLHQTETRSRILPRTTKLTQLGSEQPTHGTILKSQLPIQDTSAQDTMFKNALSYYETKDYLSALTSFEHLVAKFPHNEKLLFNLALTYYQLHLIYPESQLSYLAYAVKFFKRALLENPYYTPALHNLIFIQLQIFFSHPQTPPYLFIRELYEREQHAAFLKLTQPTEPNLTPNNLYLFNPPTLRSTLKKYFIQNPKTLSHLLRLLTFTLIALSLLLVLKLKTRQISLKKRFNLLIIPSAVLYAVTTFLFLTVLIINTLVHKPPVEGIVQKKQIPVYLEASSTQKPLTHLQEGTLLTLEAEHENWIQISMSHTFKNWAETQLSDRAHAAKRLTQSATAASSEAVIFRGWVPAESILSIK